MAADVEPAKKFLLPYLQRADELQKHEPLVAYYCRLYAMERGLKIPAKERTKTTNQILVSLMNQLEKDKKVIQLSPDDNLYVEGFALNVFAKADKQDRAGRADLNTAKTFYAASIFLEILHQFGPLQSDIEQKHKYALWKAADIRKALNEGRKPVPGPPNGDDDLPSSPQEKNSDSSTSTSHVRFPSTGFPDERVAKLPEDGSYAQQPPNARFLAPSPSKVFQPDNDKHLHHNNDYGMPLHHEYTSQPSSYVTPMGDAPPFSGHHIAPTGDAPPFSGHHFIPTGDAPPFSGHHFTPTGDALPFSGHPQPANFAHDYTQVPPTGLSYPNMPTTYVADYFQGGSVPSAVTYPTSASVNTDYGGYREPVGLERTVSAPLSTSKGQPYQPPPDKIAEAQKAARFAVSALSFDDVPTAMSYLQQSLELLSRPSAR